MFFMDKAGRQRQGALVPDGVHQFLFVVHGVVPALCRERLAGRRRGIFPIVATTPEEQQVPQGELDGKQVPSHKVETLEDAHEALELDTWPLLVK